MIHSTGERNSIATTVLGDYAGGSIKVYSGSAPVGADSAETGTLTATITLGSPAFTGPSSGVITISGTPLTATIASTQTIGYGRVLASGDTGASSTTQKRMQFSVGTSGAELIVNTTSFVNGGTFTLSSGTYTAPT